MWNHNMGLREHASPEDSRDGIRVTQFLMSNPPHLDEAELEHRPGELLRVQRQARLGLRDAGLVRDRRQLLRGRRQRPGCNTNDIWITLRNPIIASLKTAEVRSRNKVAARNPKDEELQQHVLL